MNTPKLKFLGAMGIFGTVGIFVHYIPLPSATIAFCRGLLGVAFLLLFLLLTGKKLSLPDIKKHVWLLCLSGAAIGANWILLFESYRYTTVATATVCYYFAPLFLLLASPLIGEKLTVKKLSCIGVALVGMVFMSGMLKGGVSSWRDLFGIGLATGAALLYATVMLLNKKLRGVAGYDRTVMQLGASALVVLPYLWLSNTLAVPQLTQTQWILLIVVGVVHTGIAYTLYFGAIRSLNAQTVAVFSYLDPVIAVLLSALLLKEPMDTYNIIGTVLILGSALYSELPERQRIQ